MAANAVVIPQVMHGFPKDWSQPHGGSPIWRWVPNPEVSGRNHAAVRSSAAHTAAKTPARHRSANPARRFPRGMDIVRTLC
jgi:hypothetical protein